MKRILLSLFIVFMSVMGALAEEVSYIVKSTSKNCSYYQHENMAQWAFSENEPKGSGWTILMATEPFELGHLVL